MPRLKIANGSSEKSKAVKNVSPSWSELKRVLSTFKVKPDDRSYILAGQCPSGVRGLKRGDAVKETHLLMLDFDNKGGGADPISWDELVFDLELCLGFEWAAYTTRSYTGDSVNFRVIVPFKDGLSADKHRAAVEYVVSLLPDTYKHWLDKCSYLANQLIFLPCVKAEGSPHGHASGGDGLLDVSALALQSDGIVVDGDDDNLSALDDMIASRPVEISRDEVQHYLDALDPNTLSYGSDEGVFGWADVGMALAHQFGGSDEGFDLWVAWSERNEEKHNITGMRAKYRSFDILPRGRQPLTFASVMAEVHQRGGMMAISSVGSDAPTPMEQLLDKASEVDSLEAYNEFKDKLLKINTALLPDDARAMVAHKVYESFGKTNGVSKSVITKAITPKKEAVSLEGDGDLPKWAKGWCYIEKTCQFYHVPTDHAINREAFNARYDREPDCIGAEMSASQLLLVYKGLPTYADTMYWPGADRVFQDESGKQMVNAYIKEGVTPSEVISEAGQKAVDAMLAHLEMLVPDERERNIVLNWLTHVYQSPGERINWALLIQGAQGTGKSYFSVIMSYLLGRNARTLEAGAIAERFTGWAHGSVLTTIEEVRISGTSKFDILDRMKTYISNETVQIEEKGRDHRVVPNFTNYLMLTNHKDALPIGKGDRRYCVIYTDIQSEQELFERLGGSEAADVYFNDLFDSTREHIADIAAFFRDRVIDEDFKAKGRAPETRARVIMQSLSISGEHGEIENALSVNACPVISDNVVDATWLQKLSEGEGVVLPQTRALHSILVDMGYEPIEKRVYIAKTKSRHRIWIKPKNISADEAEQLVKNFHDKDANDCPF